MSFIQGILEILGLCSHRADKPSLFAPAFARVYSRRYYAYRAWLWRSW